MSVDRPPAADKPWPKEGDRVRLIGLDGPTGPFGTVERTLGGHARGMVRVRWHDTGARRRTLHAVGSLEVVNG